MESALKTQYANNDQLVIASINKDYLPFIHSLGTIDGFPTMKYITDNGKKIESYESSSISKKDRSVDSFINWVESKISSVVSTTPSSSASNVYKRLQKPKNRTIKSKKTLSKSKSKGKNKGKNKKSKSKGKTRRF
jgi:hypothetical protein